MLAHALVILCLAFSLALLAALFVSDSHPTDDGFMCFQSFVSDCVTKDPSVKSEVARARTRDSVSCFLTFDGCGVVCVSSDSMLTVFRVSSTLSDRLRDERGTRETRGCWRTRDSVCVAFSLT